MDTGEPVLVYAAWPRRVLAALLDVVVMTALIVPVVAPRLNQLLEETPDVSQVTVGVDEVRFITVVSMVVQVVYMTAMHAWRGATIGKMIARTTVVRDDGAKVSPATAFVRAVSVVGINFASTFLLAPLFVDNLRPLWHPRRQTWHDQIAGTVVVNRVSDG